MGLACVTTAYVVLWRTQGVSTGWWLILAGFSGWVLGDGVYSMQMALGWDGSPGPADVLYIAAYGLTVAGLAIFVPRRRERGELTTLLDAAVITTGVAVVIGAFVLLPISAKSELSGLGKVTAALYPVADVLLLGVLVRAWSVPSARPSSARLVLAALSAVLVGDTLYTLTTVLQNSCSRTRTTTLPGSSATSCSPAPPGTTRRRAPRRPLPRPGPTWARSQPRTASC